jgi:hypothetical protein
VEDGLDIGSIMTEHPGNNEGRIHARRTECMTST